MYCIQIHTQMHTPTRARRHTFPRVYMDIPLANGVDVYVS